MLSTLFYLSDRYEKMASNYYSDNTICTVFIIMYTNKWRGISAPAPCAANPCLNGGTCHYHVDGTHICQCPEHYGGENCQYCKYIHYRPHGAYYVVIDKTSYIMIILMTWFK